MATKATSPVWGFHPLHHVTGDVGELSSAILRYSPWWWSRYILDSAKLHYCYSNVICAAFSALSSSAFPAPPPLVAAWSFCPVVLLLGLPFACLCLCWTLCASSASSAFLLSPALTQAQMNGESFDYTNFGFLEDFCLVGFYTEWRDTDAALLWPTKVTQDSRIASARKGRLSFAFRAG